VSGVFEVRYAEAARQDLLRLFDFLLERARTTEDFDAAQEAIDAIRDAVQRSLSRAPFAYRKAGDSPFLRELLIPFGATGYVVLFEIEGSALVQILAVRYQLEDDYH
jgi:plasmid stabilization system protein ParE